MTIGMIDQGFHRAIVRRYAFVPGNRRGFPELFHLVYPYSHGGTLQNFVLKRRSITIVPMLLSRVFHFYFRFSLKFHPVFTGGNVRMGDIYFHSFFPRGSARNENIFRGNVYGSDVNLTDLRYIHLHPLLGEGGGRLLYCTAFACFTNHFRTIVHDRIPSPRGDEISASIFPSYYRSFSVNFAAGRGMWGEAKPDRVSTTDSRSIVGANLVFSRNFKPSSSMLTRHFDSASPVFFLPGFLGSGDRIRVNTNPDRAPTLDSRSAVGASHGGNLTLPQKYPNLETGEHKVVVSESLKNARTRERANTRFAPTNRFFAAVGANLVFARNFGFAHFPEHISFAFARHFETAPPVFTLPGFWGSRGRMWKDTFIPNSRQLKFQIDRQSRGFVSDVGFRASDLFFLSFFRHQKHDTTERIYSSPGIFQQPSSRRQPWGVPLHGMQEFLQVTHAGAGHALYSYSSYSHSTNPRLSPFSFRPIGIGEPEARGLSRLSLFPFLFRPIGKPEERYPTFEKNSTDQKQEQFTGQRIFVDLSHPRLSLFRSASFSQPGPGLKGFIELIGFKDFYFSHRSIAELSTISRTEFKREFKNEFKKEIDTEFMRFPRLSLFRLFRSALFSQPGPGLKGFIELIGSKDFSFSHRSIAEFSTISHTEFKRGFKNEFKKEFKTEIETEFITRMREAFIDSVRKRTRIFTIDLQRNRTAAILHPSVTPGTPGSPGTPGTPGTTGTPGTKPGPRPVYPMSSPLPQMEYFHPLGTLQRETQTSLDRMEKSSISTVEEETVHINSNSKSIMNSSINKAVGSDIAPGWDFRGPGFSHQQRQTGINIDELTDRVYRTLEKKIRVEKEMRGW